MLRARGHLGLEEVFDVIIGLDCLLLGFAEAPPLYDLDLLVQLDLTGLVRDYSRNLVSSILLEILLGSELLTSFLSEFLFSLEILLLLYLLLDVHCGSKGWFKVDFLLEREHK